MANPHSLQSTHSRRIAAQLPFSPSPSTNSIGGSQRRNPTSPAKPSSLPPHIAPIVRSGSLASSRSRNVPSNVITSGEIPPLPTIPPSPTRPSAHGTFVPAISPTTSYFSHSRSNGPTSPPHIPTALQFQRPSSPGSIISSEAHALTPVNLGQLSKQYTRESDVSDSVNPSTEDLHHSFQPIQKTTLPKHSREPLLPSGSPRFNIPSRPSITVTSESYGGDSLPSAGGRVRDSFEKLFKRRQSSEIQRKAGPSKEYGGGSPHSPNHARSAQNSSPISLSTPHGRMTFETDDDGAYLTTSRYKGSSSPADASSISLTHMTFNPNPPLDMNPPLADTPIPNEKTGKPTRRYEVYPSQNRYFFRGRVLVGGDSPLAFLASLTVVIGITGVFFGTTCVWWWSNESPAVAAVGAYMCLLTISSMCATAFRDPGILPRDLDPDPPYAAPNGSQESLRAPLPRDLRVRAGTVRVKYCPTCRTYRPPRSSHCKMCDNCVDNCDHHCQWVNNCIGRRNYTTFFTFLFSGVLTLVLVICTTAIHLWLLTRHRYGLSFKQALGTSQGIGSAVAFMMSILVIWPVSALLAYHLRLLLLNVTTIEQIRNQAHKTLNSGPAPPNPFSHGNWRRNLLYVLCRPVGYSWLDARGLATEDKREINPGLLADDLQAAIEEGHGNGKGQ
ncbi:hypothetical protein QCA50_003318 [Cerrena zonata]|uniref:Palmitoyltransferase n=1 Tax=Cerrena zonata TaxID=2478898 RepID=A0AAW0GLX8_9APHY